MNDSYEEKITIDESHYPVNVVIDGADYYLFCEFNCNYLNSLVKVYANDDSKDVVVNYGGFASVGFYSLEPGKVNVLFDMIENSVSLKKGFDIYSQDDMKKYLAYAEASGKKYPVIQNALEMGFTKDTIKNRIHQYIGKHRSSELLNETSSIRKVEYVVPELDKDEVYINPDILVLGEEKEEVAVVMAADNLPKGWQWIQYNDGSGHLESPDRNSYFSYDKYTSYTSMNGIEYRMPPSYEYDVFYGSFEEFKAYAETTINKEFYSIENIPSLMRGLEDNAWNGNKPTSICLSDGKNIISLQGYTYEPSYEFFSATSSISLNGKILYGEDSRCVAAYRYERYQTGVYDNLEAAISHIKEKVDVSALRCIPERSQVDKIIANAKVASKECEARSDIDDNKIHDNVEIKE